MSAPDTIAIRSSWKTEALPSARAALHLDADFSAEEFARLKRGVIPQQMEDKWFIFYEDPWLYFHRSWTGYAIYGLRIECSGNRYQVAEGWTGRDPQQHLSESDEHEVATLRVLLHMLVHRDEAAPPPKELIDAWRRTLPQQPARKQSFWQRLIGGTRQS